VRSELPKPVYGGAIVASGHRRGVGPTLDTPPPGEPGSRRWIVLGVSTTVNALAWGARATFALFFVSILAEFPWGRGPTAFGYSLSWLCFVGFAPVAGWLHDRWGALYTPDGVTRLVDALNARLRERQPMLAAERGRLQTELREVRHRLDGLRRFAPAGGLLRAARWPLRGVPRPSLLRLATVGPCLTYPPARRGPLQVHPASCRKLPPRPFAAPCSRVVPGPGRSFRATWNAS
jgi:hypothetical protein